MENTQTVNPQSSTGAIEESTSAVQQSAGGDVLREYDSGLSVEQTGLPQGVLNQFIPQSASDYFVWLVVVFVVIVLVVTLTSRLIKESIDDDIHDELDDSVPSNPEPRASASISTVKKSSTKKRSAPNQRRKKTQQKKR